MEREKAKQLPKEVFWLFVRHSVIGFFTRTAETRPDEHVFHMMSFHVAATTPSPGGAQSFFTRLILALIEKR